MLCFEDKNESAVVIDSSTICIDCIKDSIIPRFYEAVKHEFNWPVEWSAGIVMDPKDFKDFFEEDEYGGFAQSWWKKKWEYETLPHANRLYCKNVKQSGEVCDAFLGDRTAFLFDIVHCRSCDVWVCKHCGVKDGGHECKASTEDHTPYGLEGCKRCPGCKGLIELKDGCNLVMCQMGSCGTEFCYVCLAVRPSREHFNRGMPCPKFGEPTDARRLYADDVVEQEHEEEEHAPDDETNLVHAAANVYRDQTLLTVQGPTNELPVPISEAMLAIATMPFAAPAMFEQRDAVNQILLDPAQVRMEQLGIVARDRQLMHSILNTWQEIEDDMRDEGLLIRQPTLGEDLRDAAANLHANLELYVDAHAVRNAFEDFQRRHELIMNFVRQHLSGDFFRFSAAFYSAFVLYREVAPVVMAATDLEMIYERAVENFRAMENGRGFDTDEIMEDADASQGQNVIHQEPRQIVRDDLGEMDNAPTDERERDVWVMRVRARIAILRAIPPGHPNRRGNRWIVDSQREIMQNDRIIAFSIAFMGTDGFREILADMEEPDQDDEHQAELATKFMAAMNKLATNLGLYTHWNGVRNAHAEYTRRHEEIMKFIKENLPRVLFQFEPELYAVFMLYKIIAPERLAAAAPRRVVRNLPE